MAAGSLAKQLAELGKPAPADFDPEDIHLQPASAQDDGDANENDNANAGREHYLEVGPSKLRKQRDTVSDPKYEGVRISRKQLYTENDDDSNSNSSLSDDEDPPEPSADEDVSDLEPSLVPPHVDHPKDAGDTRAPPPPDNDLSVSLKRAREEERKKGKAVARQQNIYDTLVDARIRLQKTLTAVNRFPNASGIPSYLNSPEARTAADGLLEEALALADDLFDLQEKLLRVNDLQEAPSRKRRRIESPPERDWDEELGENSSHFSQLESSFHPQLVSTLQKWSNKVLAIDPSALLPSTRNKFSRTADAPKSVVQLVDDALLDRPKLLERSREWRGKGERLPGSSKPIGQADDAQGELEEADEAADVYDDTDFYQQLLRDVIDSRSGGDGLGGGAAEDWRESQRQRKAKKSVDTRASKGRKLRFEVHEKLQNFMAPVLQPSGAGITWHDTQIDELFASLLGRGYEAQGADTAADPTSNDQNDFVQQALNDGFRVFG